MNSWIYNAITLLSQLVFRPLFKYILQIRLKIEVRGRENLTRLKKPLILTSNHPSLIDPFLLAIVLPARFLPIHFATHRHLFNFWPSRFLFWLFGAFPIEARKKSRGHEGVEHAIRYLRQGANIGIFPEGGLSEGTGQIKRIHKGVIVIHQTSNTPIVPVVINNLPPHFRSWKNFFPPKRKEVLITFGKPIVFDNNMLISAAIRYLKIAITHLSQK